MEKSLKVSNLKVVYNLIIVFFLISHLQFGSLSGSGGNQLFGAHYDAVSDEEVFYNGQGQRLFSVKYKSGLLPTQWSLSGLEPNCSQTFDR
jgi:hypothetical protein